MESLLNALMPYWPGMIFRQRSDLSFIVAAGQLEELTGHSPERWKSEPGLLWEVIHELDGPEYRRQLARLEQRGTGELTQIFRIRHARTGRVRHLSEFRRVRLNALGKVEGFEGFWLDATRQAVAERRLAGAVWKETLGVLTLGLTHDFNNVLAGILGLSEAWLAQLPKDHPFTEGLALMKSNARHGADLIGRIAQLHRVSAGTRGYHNLNDVVKDSLDLLRKALPGRLEMTENLEPQALPLYVDAVELRQVVIHLALNAVDAMPERGTLTIRTGLVESIPPIEHGVGIPPRPPAVVFSVRDTGTGIKPRFLPLLFDPFFTTKPMNRGSGLGLYNARLFVEKHQGAISVESREGSGSTFQVWLPLADFTEQERALQVSRGQRRSLLVCGPAGRLRDETAEFLRQHNYYVVAASADAEDLLRSGDHVFDGILLLAEPGDRVPLTLVHFVRRQQLSLRVIVKAVGCSPDELPGELTGKADLTVGGELPADAVVEQLADLLALSG